MRIKLVSGKQKELILKAKGDQSWSKFSKRLGIGRTYLSDNLIGEKLLLPNKLYTKLNGLAVKNYDKFVLEKREDNWGQIKGGINTPKTTKRIVMPKQNLRLAEAVGILLGDGHIAEYTYGKRRRCYNIKIAGNSLTDRDYLINYIPKLFEGLFGVKGRFYFDKKSNSRWFMIDGKELVDFLKSKGLNSGNKMKNNQGIPKWIKNDQKFLAKCIKGLIDTDGSVHKISKNRSGLRISFTGYIPRLLNDVRLGLIKLGFSPSKIISNKQIFLTKKEDIKNYVQMVGFSNQKNLSRLKSLRY